MQNNSKRSPARSRVLSNSVKESEKGGSSAPSSSTKMNSPKPKAGSRSPGRYGLKPRSPMKSSSVGPLYSESDLHNEQARSTTTSTGYCLRTTSSSNSNCSDVIFNQENRVLKKRETRRNINNEATTALAAVKQNALFSVNANASNNLPLFVSAGSNDADLGASVSSASFDFSRKGGKGGAEAGATRLLSSSFMNVIYRISGVTEVVLIVVCVFVMSTFLEFQSCPQGFLEFITTLSEVSTKLFSPVIFNFASVGYYGTFLFVEFFIYSLSRMMLKSNSNRNFMSLLITCLILLSVFNFMPFLHSDIAANLYQITNVGLVKVFVIFVISHLTDIHFVQPAISKSGKEVVQLSPVGQFFVVNVGLVGMFVVSLTCLWDGLSSEPVDNYLSVVSLMQAIIIVTVVCFQAFPNFSTILAPGEHSTNFSFIFESFVWLPLGMTMNLRYLRACPRQASNEYFMVFSGVHVLLGCSYVIVSSLRLNKTLRIQGWLPDGAKRYLLLLSYACEFTIVLMWFLLMGFDCLFVIFMLMFIYVLLIRDRHIYGYQGNIKGNSNCGEYIVPSSSFNSGQVTG